jgi:hypothetical protein
MAKHRELPPPPPDKLEKIRDAVRRNRDLQLEVAALEEALKGKAADLLRIQHEELPDLFAQVGMRVLELEAEGNLPAYTARAAPYYRANIAADWDPARRNAAFEWLARRDPKTGGPGPAGGDNPDIIKTVITVTLGRGEKAAADALAAELAKRKIPFQRGLAVPWNTLTAFVRELVEDRKIMPPLDLLGAQVGRIVTVKPAKESA